MREEDKIEARRVMEFFMNPKTEEEIFYHLCFCLCVPQAKWSATVEVVKQLREQEFYTRAIPEQKLHEILRPTRFYEAKTSYILEAKKQFRVIRGILVQRVSDGEKRRRLIKSVKGFGPKASSHFLRNMGHRDIAIIDVHSLRHLGGGRPTSIKQYEILEEKYRELARQEDLSVGEYDLYIWKIRANVSWDLLEY